MPKLDDLNASAGGFQVLADRTHSYNAPIEVIYTALTVDDERTWWVGLQPGEVLPQVLSATPLEHVRWSSFWPVSPDDVVEFDLWAMAGARPYLSAGKIIRRPPTALRLRWLSPTPPDERGIGISRQRLNRKLGGDLRAVVSAYYWEGSDSQGRVNRPQTS
jgi:hypothetical protein